MCRNLNVLTMLSQQWPRDSLHESGAKTDDLLVNNVLSQKPNLKQEMMKAQNQRCTFSYDHMQEWQASCRVLSQPSPLRKEKAGSRLPVSLQGLQSLQQRVPEGVPVGGAERVQQGVHRFMVGGAQVVVHLVEGVTYHLQGNSAVSNRSHLGTGSKNQLFPWVTP